MYRFYLAAVDMLPGVLILAPIYCMLNQVYFPTPRRTASCFIFSCYLSAVYVVVGLPNVSYIRPEANLNLIPVIGIIDDCKNCLLNVLLFVPLGAALPALWATFRQRKNILLFGFGASLAIELLQMPTFRTTDVNDLITNTLGTYLGFLFSRRLFPQSKTAANGNTGELCVVITVVLLTMFFVYPFVSSVLWDLILT